MPVAVSGQAVAAMRAGDSIRFFSFMGIGGGLSRADITSSAFMFNSATGRWSTLAQVPGPAGRLAATAQALGGKVYIFGGFTVDSRRREETLARVDVFAPGTRSYGSGAPLPVPVDDTVSGVWRGRLIYLVSGWSRDDNVSNVQYYDPAADRWAQATPIPGPPVFGHAGGIVGDTIVYCDGVRVVRGPVENFRLLSLCFRGDIDPSEPGTVDWTPIPPHPGRPLYRMAAGVLESEGAILFAGGADTPYNYSGIGYDGTLASPSRKTYLYSPGENRWRPGPDLPEATMDHGGLAGAGDRLFLAGGMTAKRRAGSGMFEISPHRRTVFSPDQDAR